MKPTVLDLFCGIGGFSKGFEKAGFKILLGIDNWDVALETFAKNHKDTDIINSDIKEIEDCFYESYRNKVDVVIAGPPCQGFSMSGKRDPNDKRNTLFEEVIRAVSIIKPNIVVLENVVGLLSMETPDGSLVKELIVKKFSEISYETECRVLNAADFGVPQKRRRVIFIASKIGGMGFPEPTHIEKPFINLKGEEKPVWITVGDALGNIPDTGITEYLPSLNKYQETMSNGEKTIYNHVDSNHAEGIIKRMSFVPPGGNWKDVPKEYYNVGGEHSNNYRRLDPEKPSITIKHASKSMIIHPSLDRVLTVREVARLQSFYDSFILSGTKYEQHQQLANAVPPLLGLAIANKIKDSLIEKNDFKGYEFAEIEPKQESDCLTFIDLFSGIGGFRIAFEGIGAKCAFSSEIDKWANQTYYENFGEWPRGDITKTPSDEIPDHDILCAGFPCQPFSTAGHRKGFEDTRGTLFFDVVRILKDKEPKAFILENVKGILNHDKGNTIKVIRNSLNDIGYTLFESVIKAEDHNLPQNRERWFCVGFRKNCEVKNFSFPEAVPLNTSVADFLENDVTGHEPSDISWKHIKKHYKEFKLKKNKTEDLNINPTRQSYLITDVDGLSPCLTTSNTPLIIVPDKEKHDNYTIVTQVRPSRCSMRDDGLSPCLTAKMGTGGNNIPVIVELKRKFTTGECLRLMGFPDDFKIKENSYRSYKQIGNSVPVPIVKRIGGNILKVLNGNRCNY